MCILKLPSVLKRYWGNCPGGKCQGRVFFSRRELSGRVLSGGELSLWGSFPGGTIRGGNCPGENLPRTVLIINDKKKISFTFHRKPANREILRFIYSCAESVKFSEIAQISFSFNSNIEGDGVSKNHNCVAAQVCLTGTAKQRKNHEKSSLYSIRTKEM